MKIETSKILNKNFCLWLKLKTFVFDTSFENKALSEELQDYKVNLSLKLKGYKIKSIWREGLQDYKRGSLGP